MHSRRRLLFAAIAFAVAFGALAPSSGAEDPPIDPGAQPVEEGVVHSWALVPAGSADPTKPGDRSTLTYQVAPGAELDDAVTLFNYSNVQLNFTVYGTDAYNNEDGAFDLLTTEQEPSDVGSWITVIQENVTVPARSQVTLPVTLKVPADASPGDHVGAIVASSVAQGTGPDGKIVNLDRRTGSRVYLRVDGPLNPELVVESVKTTYKPALNPLSGTANVTYRIRNRGNVRLQGAHSVSVSGFLGFGKKSTKVQDLPELLPGEDFTVHATFDGVPATGLAFTDVHLQPRPIDGDEADLSSADRRGLALAPPLTVIMLALAVWLALYARRAYRRHRRDQLVVGAQLT
jgi:hypothetical protein